MKRETRFQFLSLCIFVILLLNTAYVLQMNVDNSTTTACPDLPPISQSQSTDPGNPINLIDDVTLTHTYSSSTDYYYRIGLASGWIIRVVWLQPVITTNNFDLLLYNDTGYSQLLSSSIGSANGFEWIVYHAGNSLYSYPKVHSQSGSSGVAYIQQEMLTPATDTKTGALDATDCIDGYSTRTTSSGNKYRVNLEVPVTGDFDLYIYYDVFSSTYLNGAYSYYNSTQYKLKSASVGLGIDEAIDVDRPALSDINILVVRTSGSGTYTLTITEIKPIPAFVYVNLLIGFAIAVLFIRYLRRQKLVF